MIVIQLLNYLIKFIVIYGIERKIARDYVRKSPIKKIFEKNELAGHDSIGEWAELIYNKMLN